jgi:hypothetical protein
LSLDEAKNAGNTVVLARLFNEVQASKDAEQDGAINFVRVLKYPLITEYVF